ncbi:hypothetical protein [Goodfellowiella coeruleoviolacea]|uniref:hypothetical protein n=1 Tax=Goodfellowiella coeruleoviolacea TaxID=334858 RepID=UPI0020A2F7AE|nr:hypothetical protein [Goodfellowiella coeruleoviolacea]
MTEEEHHDAVLAEIILSKKVGTEHFRLVGDLISARAQLSMGILARGGLSLDELADAAETVIELEDAYKEAWADVDSVSGFNNVTPKLPRLTETLENAVRGIHKIAKKYGIRIE